MLSLSGLRKALLSGVQLLAAAPIGAVVMS
jgi:hypothetical protein